MAINFQKIIQGIFSNDRTKAAPLAVFRILFGFMMVYSLIRFWYHGWIESLYIEPKFHFHYLGFDFIQVPGVWTYLLFIVCGLSALCIAIGYKYSLATTSFFLTFVYIELMDKTTYLNHYYFISVISFMLIWLPAHCYFSLDAYKNVELRSEYIDKWHINVLKIILSIVYIYAGLAKLNYDWMVEALPLGIWLSSKTHLPLIGSLLNDTWVHYLFSWGGAAYDIFIVFFLMWRKTRPIAFLFVLFFHVLTRFLFPIGMFPFIMIISTLIFFDDSLHEKIITAFSRLFKIAIDPFKNGVAYFKRRRFKYSKPVLCIVIIIQLLFPWRYLLYPGNVFWTEEGYRFSWRVMLMEKAGDAQFKIVNGETGKRFYVQNDDFLTTFQEKQMATQPDFIIEYAHFLGRHFESQGHEHVEVYVDSYVALNGRPSQQYIDPNVDLLKVKNSIKPKNFILPFNE